MAGRAKNSADTTILAMLGSGSAAATIGLAFAHPGPLVLVALAWGFTIAADSPQFSAALTELAPPRYVGTALSLQTGAGFLLTLLPIWLVPLSAEALGWPGAFAVLAPGPFLGAVAMWRLRRLPESRALAGGAR